MTKNQFHLKIKTKRTEKIPFIQLRAVLDLGVTLGDEVPLLFI